MVPSLVYPVDAEWRVRGNCRDLRDPDVMTPHPKDYRGIAKAKGVCAACPVQIECLDDAIRRDERHGVWGGQTPAERGAPRALVGRSPRAATRKCRFCGIRRPAGQVVERRCTACTTTVHPPVRLLQVGDDIAAFKRQQESDRLIARRLGFSAAEVTAARRVLGIDSYGHRRAVAA